MPGAETTNIVLPLVDGAGIYHDTHDWNSSQAYKVIGCNVPTNFIPDVNATPSCLQGGGGICGYKTGSYDDNTECSDEATCRERYLVEIENCMVKGTLGIDGNAGNAGSGSDVRDVGSVPKKKTPNRYVIIWLTCLLQEQLL